MIMMTMMIADMLRGFTSQQAPSFYRHHHLVFVIKLCSFAVNIIALKSQDFGSNPSSATSSLRWASHLNPLNLFSQRIVLSSKGSNKYKELCIVVSTNIKKR